MHGEWNAFSYGSLCCVEEDSRHDLSQILLKHWIYRSKRHARCLISVLATGCNVVWGTSSVNSDLPIFGTLSFIRHGCGSYSDMICYYSFQWRVFGDSVGSLGIEGGQVRRSYVL